MDTCGELPYAPIRIIKNGYERTYDVFMNGQAYLT